MSSGGSEASTLTRQVCDGRTLTALFGRSGAGKTSLVNVIGGLLRPDRGRIAVDGRVLIDTERGIDIPTHRRRIGYVFQESRLFPHLTVRQNLHLRALVHARCRAARDAGAHRRAAGDRAAARPAAGAAVGRRDASASRSAARC